MNEPLATPKPEVLFFGCTGRAGHHLCSKTRRVSIYTDTPWGVELDTGLLRNRIPDVTNGEYVLATKNGWTAMAFWDRSGGDTRPGCCSVFIVPEMVDSITLLALAREQWPEIFARPGFPLKQ